MSNIWNDFEIKEFTFEDRNARIIFPKEANEGKNWTLKTEYRDAFPQIELELLNRGFHVLWLENNNRWATKEDCDAKARFTAFVSKEYGLNEKCVPVGMSCGGAHAVNFAGFYPECVQCMYIDAPVMNFLSIPAVWGKGVYGAEAWDNEFVKAYPGITRTKLLNFDNHPVLKAPILIENKIPVIMVYGDCDAIVVYEENGGLFEKYYEDHKELLKVVRCPNREHHPHGIPGKPEVIADFICEHI